MSSLTNWCTQLAALCKKSPVSKSLEIIGKDHIRVSQQEAVRKPLLFECDWYHLDLSIFGSTHVGGTHANRGVEKKQWMCKLFCFFFLTHRGLTGVESVISLRTNHHSLSCYGWQETLYLSIANESISLEYFHVSWATWSKQNVRLHWAVCNYYQNKKFNCKWHPHMGILLKTNKQEQWANKQKVSNQLPGKKQRVLVQISALLNSTCSSPFQENSSAFCGVSSHTQAEPNFVCLVCAAIICVGKLFLSSYNELSKCPPTQARSPQCHLPVKILAELILAWASLFTLYKFISRNS